MLRKLKHFIVTLLALLLILLATLSALLGTQAGSHWLVNFAAQKVGVSLGDLKGNLREGLDVSFVEYQEGELRLRAEQLSFRWRPAALLYTALSLQSVQAQRLLVQLPPAAEQDTAAQPFNQWPSLRLPLRIELNQLDLRNIEFQQGATHEHWQRLSGSIGLGTFHLRYNKLALVHRDYGLSLSGRTELGFPYSTTAQLRWHYQPSPQPSPGTDPVVAQVADSSDEATRYEGLLDISGNLNGLALAAELTSPATLTATLNLPLVDAARVLQTSPQAELALQWGSQALPAVWWVPGQAAPVSAGHLTAKGSLQDYKAELKGEFQAPDLPALGVQAQVQGNLSSINISQLLLTELQAAAASTSADPAAGTELQAAALSIAGDLQWLPHLAWQLQLDATQLNLATFFPNWPSAINARFASSGRQQGSGWQASFAELQLAGSLRGLNLEARGGIGFDGSRWQSDALTIILGANQLNLSGSLGDSLGESLDLKWDLRAPLLSQVSVDFNGSLNSSGELRGTWALPQLDMQLDAQNFSWGDYALESLQLNLHPQQQMSDGPLLTQLVGAAPVASSSTRKPQRPSREWLLGQAYDLKLLGKNLQLADQQISQLNISGQGSIAQHQLKALLKSNRLGKFELVLKGHYAQERWQGQLSQLDLRIKKVPSWWLTSSKPITISAQEQNLGELCMTTRTNLTMVTERSSATGTAERGAPLESNWYHNVSLVKNPYSWLAKPELAHASPVEIYAEPQLCLRARHSLAAGLNAKLRVDSVPLRQFYALFKTEVYFAGVMDGSFTFTAPSPASPDFSIVDIQAAAALSTRNAQLRYQVAGGSTEVYSWRDFTLTASMDKGLLKARSAMDWQDYGTISADTELDLAQQQINSGKLQAHFNNLAPLETLLSFSNNLQGDLRANMIFGGSFKQPYIQGGVDLRNGSAFVPKLGLTLKEISANLVAEKSGDIRLTSNLQSGKGQLSIVGDMTDAGSDHWQLQGVVEGSAFQVVNLPQLKARLSPQINVKANPKSLHLAGDALIPWARANFKTLPASATQVSSDVIIIDEKLTLADKSKAMQIYTNINLILGESVTLQGFGLKSKLSGQLNLLKETQRPALTTGFVKVDEGSYKAYGQNLNIERGRLIFQGAYENPGLDIRAVRKIPNAERETKVGLEIGGTLQRPKAKVVSVPASSESEAMMMLLTGKPINEASKADASMLISAVGGLGVDSSQMITAEIAQFFGIDEFEIKSDNGIDQSQLWVGKYLTPKLLVHYVKGIFDDFASVGMRYQLTDKLRLDAEAGEVQSVDMIYKIER